MNLKQLECFVRVAELGSFTRAAAILGISQPVLSRSVRQLELHLKKHLLYRNGRGVTPTASGKRLLAHGKGILHQVSLARQELETERDQLMGRVVVGWPPSVGRLLTVPLVSHFRAEWTRASIGIVEALTASLQEWLLTGRVDFALLYDPPPIAGLTYERIWSEDLCLIGSASKSPRMPARVRAGDLSRYPLIIPSRPNAIRNRIENECSRRGIALTIDLEIDAIASVLDLIERGHGYGILARHAISGRGETLRAAPIRGPSISSSLVVASAPQRPLTTLARQTVEAIKAMVAGGLFGPIVAASRRRSTD